ncbi:MAG: T9SS type A sorting domain-containing protein, partial [Flavobacteriales bacterium]|nr:T9SS type A sorting domain-containing protein [Flavobacteriales bacterium]
YYTNSDLETFLLRAWSDSSGMPAQQLGENYEFHTPQYFTDGYDLFAFYAYDDPIPVDGIVHVGLVQANDAMLNFGLDKNTNANFGEVHYQLGLGGSWISSEIPGTVMIRPVLRAGKEEIWSAIEEPNGLDRALYVYPNPSAAGTLNAVVQLPGNWELWNVHGQRVDAGNWVTPGLHSISTINRAPGIYILQHSEGFSARVLIQ